MNIAICDDNMAVVNSVQKLVDKFFKELKYDCEIYTFNSGNDLLERNVPFDLAFLDIEMPGMNGLELAQKLKEKNVYTRIIFITSYQHYLDDALEVNPYGYISKPIDKMRFNNVLKKTFNKYLKESKPLFIKSNDEVSKVNTCDIIYAAIEQRKVHLHTVEQDIVTNESFEYWKEKLNDECFIQIHQSYIVNMNYVQKITKTSAILSCNSNVFEVHVSARKYAAFKKAFYKFLGGSK